jgi:hypothetical protein
MRSIVSGSVTLTIPMYQDDAARAAAWAQAVQAATDTARDQGLTPLRPDSYFASAAFYTHDEDGVPVICRPDQATYVRITAEITCEDTHAENR